MFKLFFPKVNYSFSDVKLLFLFYFALNCPSSKHTINMDTFSVLQEKKKSLPTSNSSVNRNQLNCCCTVNETRTKQNFWLVIVIGPHIHTSLLAQADSRQSCARGACPYSPEVYHVRKVLWCECEPHFGQQHIPHTFFRCMLFYTVEKKSWILEVLKFDGWILHGFRCNFTSIIVQMEITRDSM